MMSSIHAADGGVNEHLETEAPDYSAVLFGMRTEGSDAGFEV